MSTPSIIWSLEIKHDYYLNGYCKGITVLPLPETSSLFARRNLIFRQTGVGEWALYSFERSEIANNDSYHFNVNLLDNKLLYVTEPDILIPEKAFILNIDNTIPTIQLSPELDRISSIPGTIMRIQLEIKDDNPETSYSTVIQMNAARLYWEYIFLFRNADETNDRTLILENVESEITFPEPEKLAYYGKPAIKFRSTQQIRSSESYKSKLQLSEIIRERKRIIMQNVPYPEPGVFLDAPPGVVRSIIYS